MNKRVLNTGVGEAADHDARLVERLTARDPDAMARLYDLYGRIVYSNIIHVVHDEGIAQDLAQETFLRIWNRASAFDCSRGSLGVWLATIARHIAIDYIRSNAAKLERATEGLDKIASTREDLHGGGDPEARLLDRDRVSRIRHAVALLPEHQRRVLNLWYREELTHSEIARSMNRPLGTVKTWLRHAIQALRAQSDASALSAARD